MNEIAAPPRVDPQAVVAAIRAEVARRREAGDYPEDLLRRLAIDFSPVDGAPPLEALAHLETVRELGSTRAVTGRLVVTAKRGIRRAVAWYVRPITVDQTRFNFGVVRRLQTLETRIAELEAALAERSAGSGPTPPGR